MTKPQPEQHRITQRFRPQMILVGSVVVILLMVLALFVRSILDEGESGVASKTKEAEETKSWERMVRSEILIQDLSDNLNILKRSVMNLALPAPGSEKVFAPSVHARSLMAQPESSQTVEMRGLPITVETWGAQKTSKEISRSALNPWDPFLQRVRFFVHAKFQIKRGKFEDKAMTTFVTDLYFSGLANLNDGAVANVESLQSVTWKRDPSNQDAHWAISRWDQVSFSMKQTRSIVFKDVLKEALDEETLPKARRSIHEEHIVNWHRAPERFDVGHPYFEDRANDRHPGLSVLDINRDGWDDIYVMARWGQNLLLINKKDGTFQENASGYGLDIQDHSSCAIFADLDNDGDRDAVIGRTLKPTKLLINDEGRFMDHSSDRFGANAPSLVSSIAVADVNQDGLLDVYISTYAAKMVGRWMKGKPPQTKLPLEGFISETDAKELQALLKEGHLIRDLYGPPNILFMNQGDGRFEPADDAILTRVFRNSYQATFADIDNDGDPDLYIANDFAPNHMFRNDGGRFTDITKESKTADIGFGMGISFGDYDSDGLQDLYVSNMYSKAGIRIMERFPELDRRLVQMARGNSLFRNLGGTFEKVSGTKPHTMLVEKAGWSWGGQFVDIDNDGHLDIAALSGHYSAPKEISVPVDT